MATILIADDQPLNIETLQLALYADDYTIYTAANGAEVLALMATTSPDLILLDVMMPGMTGFEVCRRIKSSPESADVVVIFVSSLEDEVDKVSGLELGGADYITKPFSMEEVAARVRIHIALLEKQRQLEQRNRQDQVYFANINAMREDLMSQMRHDLKNPLASIKLTTSLIAHPRRQLEIGVYLGRIDNAVDEAIHIIEKLLDIAKLETGRAIEMKSVELPPFLERVIMMFEATAEAKNIRLTAEYLPNGNKSPAYFDPDQMARALENLLGNAIKFTDAGGQVTFSVQRSPNELSISVSDTGRGIGAEHLDKIFERLYRVPSESSLVEGSGLGLYIVKSIVEQHGGKIWVESVLSEGSQFHILLPQNPTP